jgi:hypothetical protein
VYWLLDRRQQVFVTWSLSTEAGRPHTKQHMCDALSLSLSHHRCWTCRCWMRLCASAAGRLWRQRGGWRWRRGCWQGLAQVGSRTRLSAGFDSSVQAAFMASLQAVGNLAGPAR